MGMPEVFEVTIVCGARAASTRANSACLTSRRSTTASITQSARQAASRSVSRLPVRTAWAWARVKNGSGRRAAARFMPSRAASAETSSTCTSKPALAAWAAIWAPIVPAPRTVTVRIMAAASFRGGHADAVHEDVDDGIGDAVQRGAAMAQHPVGRHLVEGAEEHLRRQGRVDAGADDAGGLAFGDHVAQDAEVVAEQRVREAFHELRRLPQLDLEDDGQVAVAAQAIEVQVGDAPQPLERIGDAGERGPALGDGLAHHPLEDRDEQVVLAAEVEIHGARGDAGGAGDVGDLGAEEAAAGKGADGRAQDDVALVAAWSGGAGTGAGGADGLRANGGGWRHRRHHDPATEWRFIHCRPAARRRSSGRWSWRGRSESCAT